MKKLTSTNKDNASKNRARGYKIHNAFHKEYLAKERLRYIEHQCPFVVGDSVLINYASKQYVGTVARINLKTITVKDSGDTVYRVDKISLYGYPVSVLNPGVSKAKIFELMSIAPLKEEVL